MKTADILCTHFDQTHLTPSIQCITRYLSHPGVETGEITRLVLPIWAMGYTWTPCCNIKVGTPRGKWRFREARTMHLYPPNTVFWEDFGTAKNSISGMYFLFKGGKDAGLNELIKPGQKYAKFHDPEGHLSEMLLELSKELEKYGAKAHSSALAAMWTIFNMLQKSQHLENEDYLIRDPHLAFEETFARKVENYLRGHYSEKLSLDKLAEVFGISTATLTRRFRDECETSPMARLNEIRIDIAKTMLLRGSRICEIAIPCGFSDEFHLSKTFKKTTGQSPRDFLKSLEG